MATCPSGHQSASDDFCDVCGVLIGAAPSLAPDGAAERCRPGTAAGTVGGAAAGARRALPALRRAAGRPVLRVVRLRLHPRRPGHVRPGDLPVGAAPHRPVPVPSAPPAPAAARPQAPPARPRPRPARRHRSAARPAAAARRRTGPAGRADWTAVVSADRAYYDAVQAAGGPDAAGIAFPAYFPQRRFRLAGAEVRIGRHSASSGIDPEIDLSVPPADPGVSRLHAVLLKAPTAPGPSSTPARRTGRGQRQRDPARPGRAAARRRPDPPGRVDRAAGRPRGLAGGRCGEQSLTGR